MRKKSLGILISFLLIVSFISCCFVELDDESVANAACERIPSQVTSQLVTSFEVESSFPDVPETMIVYRTVPPDISEDDMRDFCSICDLDKGNLVKYDEGYVVKEDERILIAYTKPSTGYIRYRDNEKLMSETPSLNLPHEDEAIRIAEELLENNRLLPAHTNTVMVDYSEVRKYNNDGELLERGYPSLYVAFFFSLDGFPVVGPGAKAGVVFGEGGEIIGFSRIWRDVEEDHEVTIIDLEEAIQLFKQRWLREEEMKESDQRDIPFTVHVSNLYLAYNTLPGCEPQEYLEPVYVFTGGFHMIDPSDSKGDSGCVECGEPFEIIIPAVSPE